MTRSHTQDLGWLDPEGAHAYAVQASPAGGGWAGLVHELNLKVTAASEHALFAAASQAIAAKLGCSPMGVLVSVYFD